MCHSATAPAPVHTFLSSFLGDTVAGTSARCDFRRAAGLFEILPESHESFLLLSSPPSLKYTFFLLDSTLSSQIPQRFPVFCQPSWLEL